MSDDAIEALERELPALRRLAGFARGLAGIPWFANLGEPLTPGARAAAARYVEGLGFPGVGVGILVDWEDAAAAAESLDWHAPAWEAEELLRADLTARAGDIFSEEALALAMTLIAERIADPAREAMEEAASIWDVEEESLRTLAVGAAVQAAHQAALVLAAAAADPEFGAEDHPFAAKFRLFEFGRWPVGVVGQTFNLF
jgi:hypothetical protein